MRLKRLGSNEALSLKYEILVLENEKGEEQKLERFMCPICLNAIARKSYGISTCPICNQKLDWNKL